MKNIENSPWGKHSVVLDLPALRIQFSGLSSSQYNSTKESYKKFINECSESNSIDVDCNIVRLKAPPDISVDQLTVDNQYTPLKSSTNQSGCFTVTGLDFESSYELRAPHCTSTLGTYNEVDLINAIVIENYMRILAAHWVLHRNGILLHSAGLVIDKKAYIFSGKSNAGKTTLTRKAHKSGALVLSDDINLLLPHHEGYDAHAVPFTGEFGRTLCHAGGNESYPLAGIILLQQGDCLRAELVKTSAAVARLLIGCPFVNTDQAEFAAVFDALSVVVKKVPVIKLTSRQNDNFDDIFHVVKDKLNNCISFNSALLHGSSPSLQANIL